MRESRWIFWFSLIVVFLGVFYLLGGKNMNISFDMDQIKQGVTEWFVTDHTKENSEKKENVDFLRDEGKLAQYMEEYRDTHGDSLVVYRNFAIHETHFIFTRRDPEEPKHYDRYMWHVNTGWSEPEPEQTPKDSDLYRVIDLSHFDFSIIPSLVKRAEERAVAEGISDGTVSHVVLLHRGSNDPDRSAQIVISVQGSRNRLTVYADDEGTITKVSK